MKIITRYSVAYCLTSDLSTQFGTWGNCWDTKEEVRYFIEQSWKIINKKDNDAYQISSCDWLVIEPIKFIRYNIFERLFQNKTIEERITPIAAQGSYFRT